MKKNPEPIEYFYSMQNISDDETTAYEAIIPAFNNALIFGGSLEELEEGIRFMIKSEIKDYKKKGKPIPPPDLHNRFSGKFMLRIDPQLHANLALIARANGKSLNKYISEKLERIHS